MTVLDACHFGNTLFAIQKTAGSNLKLVQEDIRTCSPSIFSGKSGVIDLAGISNDPSCELDPDLTKSVNIDGAFRLITLAKNAGVTRYVFASSCSVYGNATSSRLIESDTPSPTSLYAKAKVTVENYLIDSGKTSNKFETVALRLATVFGVSPRMRFDLAVNAMTKNAVRQNIINVNGGEQWRPFIHVVDAARGFIRALEASSKDVSNQIFNLGTNENNTSISNLALRIQQKIPSARILVNPENSDIRNYNVDFSKAASVLNFRGLKTVEFGIDEVSLFLSACVGKPEDRRWNTLDQYAFMQNSTHGVCV